MIAGRVTSEREAVVTVQISAPHGRPQTVDAVIDTGFTESVALPPDRIAGLELPLRGVERVSLADGSETLLVVYWGVVHWHGTALLVPVLETEAGALLGMALLHGSRLCMDVVQDGPVRIEAIGQANGA